MGLQSQGLWGEGLSCQWHSASCSCISQQLDLENKLKLETVELKCFWYSSLSVQCLEHSQPFLLQANLLDMWTLWPHVGEAGAGFWLTFLMLAQILQAGRRLEGLLEVSTVLCYTNWEESWHRSRQLKFEIFSMVMAYLWVNILVLSCDMRQTSGLSSVQYWTTFLSSLLWFLSEFCSWKITSSLFTRKLSLWFFSLVWGFSILMGLAELCMKQSGKFNNRTEIKFDVTNTQDKKIYQLPMLICVIATLDCLLTPKWLIVFRRHYGVNYSKAKQCVSLKQPTEDCTWGNFQ